MDAFILKSKKKIFFKVFMSIFLVNIPEFHNFATYINVFKIMKIFGHKISSLNGQH